ncbi:MAG: 7-carboxy-7-deazaguanine synthase QueE [Candidatus Neomarinimicrobiota bacterium]
MGNSKQQSTLYKINEIFYSYQAEGRWAGRAAIFIRLSGCNLRCNFCDTEFLSGIDMDVTEIMAKVHSYKAKFVLITGGEPLMQDTLELLRRLKEEDYYVALETNGTYKIGHDYFDWVTVSPKNSHIKIKKCNELRVVLDVNEYPESYGIEADVKYISPKNPTHDQEIGSHSADFFSTNVAQYCYRYVLKNPEWRLSFQTHKCIGVR